MSSDWRKILISENKSEVKKPTHNVLPFLEFLYNDLNEVKLSEVQTRESLAIIGEGGVKGDPVLFFTPETRPNLSVLLWGKGSGKGLVSANIITYVIYLLHFLEPNPHDFFGVSKADAISIITVATNQNQSQKMFDRVKARIKNSKFFNKYPIEEHGKIVNSHICDRSLPKIHIAGNTIKFSSINVEFISVPSKNESWEGLTLIAFVMDEASGHVSQSGIHNAEKIFNTATTSTRELPYLGLVTSFPRLDKKNDFTYILHEEVKNGKYDNAYTSHYFTWQVKPKKFFSKETFRIYVKEFDLEVDVPMDFKTQFDRDFNSAVAKYLALPVGYSVERWMPVLQVLDEDVFVDKNRLPLVIAESEIIKTANGNKFVYKPDTLRFTRKPEPYEYFMGIDPGEVDCMAAVAIGHGLIQRGTPLLIVDAILVWQTDKQKNVSVDLWNYYDVIGRLAKYLNITKIKSDKWNTAAFKHLAKEWDDKPVNQQDYISAKNLFYSNPPAIIFPNQEESYLAISQFKNLQPPSGSSKPRVITGYQDIADSIVGLVFWFNKLFHIDSKTDSITLSEAEARKLAVGKASTVSTARVESPLRQLVPPSNPLGGTKIIGGGREGVNIPSRIRELDK